MARGLIVDDSKFMRRIIFDTLTEGGHQVIGEADNGYDALDMYKKDRPDFVTMDITMHGKDGLMAVSEIKNIDSKAKIIVVSALSEKTLRLNDSTIQADAYIVKPFQKEELLDKIKGIL
jgi:two-component system, chemotaxis family, chemotaxis protein CheY